MSHTVTLDIRFRDRSALESAALLLGAESILSESVTFYDGRTVEGLAVRLPGWHYPLCIDAEGTLHCDHYNGMWGNPADLERLTEAYAVSVAESVAEAQGWYSERTPQGSLMIYHPDGGTIEVGPDGTVDAASFEGRDCTDATAPIEAALGRRKTETVKPEMLHERARVNVGSEPESV